MDINTVLKLGRFSDDIVKENLIKLNPKQIINNMCDSIVSIYEVEYQYTTVRNNRKDGVKNFLVSTSSPEMNMTRDFNEYIKKYNIENPNRQLSNVKILGSQCLGFVRI